jgi:hypothetical protein
MNWIDWSVLVPYHFTSHPLPFHSFVTPSFLATIVANTVPANGRNGHASLPHTHFFRQSSRCLRRGNHCLQLRDGSETVRRDDWKVYPTRVPITLDRVLPQCIQDRKIRILINVEPHFFLYWLRFESVILLRSATWRFLSVCHLQHLLSYSSPTTIFSLQPVALSRNYVASETLR